MNKCPRCETTIAEEATSCKCGWSAPRTTAPKTPMQDAPRIAGTRPCIAYGCKLAGTFNPVIHGDNHPWYCFIHSERPSMHWQRATEAINRALPEARPLQSDSDFRRFIRRAVETAISGKQPEHQFKPSESEQSNSTVMVEMREAYQKSKAYAAMHGSKPLSGTIGAIVPREPGEDPADLALGIEIDPLEREFADRANP